jgi:hypothetical protein
MTNNTDRPGILDEAAFLSLPQTIDYNPQWRSELRAGNSGDFYDSSYDHPPGDSQNLLLSSNETMGGLYEYLGNWASAGPPAMADPASLDHYASEPSGHLLDDRSQNAGDSLEIQSHNEVENRDYTSQPGFDSPSAMQISRRQSGYHVGHDGKILPIFVSIISPSYLNHRLTSHYQGFRRSRGAGMRIPLPIFTMLILS